MWSSCAWSYCSELKSTTYFYITCLKEKNIVFQTSAHLKLIRTYTNFRHTYPKLRCSYPKLWCQVPIDAQKFRIGAQKFSVGNLVFQHFKDKYADLLLPWPQTVTRLIAFWSQRQGPFLYLHFQSVNQPLYYSGII